MIDFDDVFLITCRLVLAFGFAPLAFRSCSRSLPFDCLFFALFRCRSYCNSTSTTTTTSHHDATSFRLPYASGHRQCLRTPNWYVKETVLFLEDVERWSGKEKEKDFALTAGTDYEGTKNAGVDHRLMPAATQLLAV